MYISNIESDTKQWEKQGFYCHFERDADNKVQVNYHTHGILHSRGKSDFCITQPIKPIIGKAIFTELVDKLDKGIEIFDGTELADVFDGFTLKFRQSEKCISVLKIDIRCE
ncbi:hypothetical protein Cpap_0464 [Ruminiclostridium papyrosolvens DSM 2782]|uniref:Uncharacterized protein n=1 Tax=Ruminiclostridium papyrosolvens DSM 2782 TaxID=588581 RepID=F1THG7_9FIRM|nr:hypothetical protein [Ruminiclostridium papyrosolvens]EGD46170.1 hypothetical protein Cpap_0464 [Ruminiclostridium papyrosolvens DSM 2782]WES35950.1 hypothetical protein P0092_08300 [Ruminiclostridium papyrosolvens DSM 2782]